MWGKRRILEIASLCISIKKGDVRERIPFLMQKTAFLETITVSNETEALLLENNLIKKYHPKYNVLLKDDKTFFLSSDLLTASLAKNRSDSL